MKIKISESMYLFLVLLVLSCAENKRIANALELSDYSDYEWKAKWIQPQDVSDTLNAWTVYHKQLDLHAVPEGKLIARIATDTKYWLWINGKPVVRMGGLKRGPTPRDTYYDEVDVEDFLKPGSNSIAVLVNYFGKNGFSHNNSGAQGLLFDLQGKDIQVASDSTWTAWLHPGFGETGPPHPNFRLPESNVFYDARLGDFEFTEANYDASTKPSARIAGSFGAPPWNNLVPRPIPLWKDIGLKPYSDNPAFPFSSTGDTLVAKLPYNAQISPYFKIRSRLGGDTLDIYTDHYRGGGAPNIRLQYITKPGIQEFEMPGWVNGEEVWYSVPKDVEILDLRYRETGYDTEFAGEFECDDPFFNKLRTKALRTLYVTMRDTYMDCPDRERAQWWGDEVLESGEAFYALDRKSDALVRKGILELINWQRPDSTLFSPIPAGNWNKELPGQMLASIGYYGIYNYYLHTGDLEILKTVYEPVKNYLALWKLNEDGTLVLREGGWIWGDWGDHKDIPLLLNTQYQLAQKGLLGIAKALNKQDDVAVLENQIRAFKQAFNTAFWKGDHYRSLSYEDVPDDRSQALAVLADLADADKYDAIFEVLKMQEHASPYMEKYVAEALFQMNQPDYALQRLKKRFGKMVNHPTITTLWEGWGIGSEGYGGGTTNHAWSGGGLTLLSQYVAGIFPTSPGYETFQVKPQPGYLKKITATVPSVKGAIKVVVNKSENGYFLNIRVPKNSKALIYIPKKYVELKHNGNDIPKADSTKGFVVEVGPGKHQFKAN